ncbi:MAG: amidohydrolase family protein, partial [Woeseiaceae bacterium]|nr:amidohydrolase family protein [Woeseiaceae bacterium]
GSVETAEAAFYVPNEGFEIASLEALVRVAAGAIDGEVPLFPAGSARVEKTRELTVDAPGGPSTLSLYAILGVSLTPTYAWFDEDLKIAAVDAGGWLGMIPKGWSTDVLATLSKAQSDANAEYIERMAGNLANRIDAPLIFEHVNVVDVTEGRVRAKQHVLVEDGTIAAVSDRPLTRPGAVRIDGRDRYLVPGLWDMHGHFGLADGVLNIAGGITSVRDIGGVHDKVMEMTDKFASGEVIGPTTYRAGFIDKAGPYASGGVAETLDDALEMVDFFADHGYIQIKLYSSIEPAWVAPISDRAHAHGMRVSGHIPAFMSAEQAVRAGYDEIQHINMVFLNFLAGDREDTRKQLRFTLYGDEARNVDLDSDEVKAFLDLLKKNNVVVDATAAIFETMLVHVPGEPDPTFAAVVDHLPIRTRRPLYNPEMDMTGRVETWGASAVRQSQMLKKLFDHGIQLVPGSDNMAAFTVHRELEVYAEAGIPEADVLRMATLDSARVVGVDDRTGSIDVGKDSDLLLLGENPLDDIGAVRRALLVMKGDTVYQPDELYRAIGVKPFVASVPLSPVEEG